MQEVPELGRILPAGENRRDAIHIAIAPVVAAYDLEIASHIGLDLKTGRAITLRPDRRRCDDRGTKTIGIVDPFLDGTVKEGETFYMLLYQNTVTSLRHVWTHPTFAQLAAVQREKLHG